MDELQAIACGVGSRPDSEGRIPIRCRVCGKEILRTPPMGYATVTCAECYADQTRQVPVAATPVQNLNLMDDEKESETWPTKPFRALGFRKKPERKKESQTSAEKKRRKPLLER